MNLMKVGCWQLLSGSLTYDSMSKDYKVEQESEEDEKYLTTFIVASRYL